MIIGGTYMNIPGIGWSNGTPPVANHNSNTIRGYTASPLPMQNSVFSAPSNNLQQWVFNPGQGSYGCGGGTNQFSNLMGNFMSGFMNGFRM